jgi:PilZ domain
MSDETLVRAAEALVAESALDMADDDGHLIEVWTIASDGATLRASAPRLSVREGMRLACRIILDQRPHRVVTEIIEATIVSDRRAGLLLTVVEASIDGFQREAERVPMSLRGTLTALVCDRVVPGEPITITVHDISEGGIGLTVWDRRPRAGDLYRLDLRTFEGAVLQDVQVRATRPGDQQNTQILGCAFVAPSAQTISTVHHILERQQAPHTTPQPDLRQTLGLIPQQQSNGPPPHLRPAWQS